MSSTVRPVRAGAVTLLTAVLVGCADGAATDLRTTVTVEHTTGAPATSHSPTPVEAAHDAAGLVQVLSRPGRYLVGVDIAAGSWDGIARSVTCTYAIERVDGDFIGPDEIQPITNRDPLDPNDAVATSFMLFKGDVFELGRSEFLGPQGQPCLFWNHSLDVLPPKDSDTPWRDTARFIPDSTTSDWKRGQFSYLDNVQQRISGISEAELTEMAIWYCQMRPTRMGDTDLRDTLMKFSGLSEIQADFLMHHASTLMCP